MCSRGDVKLCQNFHRADVPRIQWKRNQNSFRKRSTECKSHCTENFCRAKRPEMSSKSLQSLRRKAMMHRLTLAVNNVKSGKNDVLSTDIIQLSGHKNVQSITSYYTVSQKPVSLFRERKRYHCTTRNDR